MHYIGLILTCEFDGRIRKILLNNVCPGLTPDKTMNFAHLFNPATRDKAQSFFLSIIKDEHAEGWELIFEKENKYLPLRFSGVKISGEVLLIAEAEWESIVNSFDEMMCLNNELVNTIRNFYKTQSQRQNSKTDVEYLEEMSLLNNELVNAQRELNKKNSELTKLVELKNLFVGMVAHDLRNPIGMIREFSKFIASDLQEEGFEEQQKFLEIIVSSSDFMLKLVEDILQITAFEAGKINLKSESYQLSSLITSTVQFNQYIANKKDIKLETHMQHSTSTVSFDWIKVQQVLNNLLSNAIKYSDFHTAIRISTFNQDDYVVISVTDQGPGIAQEELKTLFSPYATGAAKSTDSEPSTGLGLVIAKNIINAHKGNLWVDSIPGKGTTFLFSLPV